MGWGLMLGLMCVGGIVVVALIAVVVGVGVYNGLVSRNVETKNAWSQIDVQLKRRYDLIPNLVETVKGYAGHEKETLERVIQARNMAMGAKSVSEQAQAENFLTGALKSLFAVSEAYPDLKANRRGATSLRWLRALLDHGVEVHGQVVVCPGVNDGDVLDDTLTGILDEYPELATVCVVPLGVSRHSTKSSLRVHTTAEAEAVKKAPQVKF